MSHDFHKLTTSTTEKLKRSECFTAVSSAGETEICENINVAVSPPLSPCGARCVDLLNVGGLVRLLGGERETHSYVSR